MAEAAVKLAASMNEEKYAKFREIGQKRMNNALKAIALIGNLSNRATYNYTESDIKKIVRALTDAVDLMESQFTPQEKNRAEFSF